MNKFKLYLFAASVMFAMAFTFSCSKDDIDEFFGVSSSSETEDSVVSSSSVASSPNTEPSSSSGGTSVLSSSSRLSSNSQTGVIHGSPVTDVDGQTYETVVIGNQTWMAKNLNRNVEGSKCYNNSDINCTIYGRLYDWATVMDGADGSDKYPSGVQGICPAGFHVPSDVEWTVLIEYVGNYGTLRATSGWNSSKNGTDKFGFSALPGGYGHPYGFENIGNNSYWWSTTVYLTQSSTQTYRGVFIRTESERDSESHAEDILYSLRCIKDFQPQPISPPYTPVSCSNIPPGGFCDDRDGKAYKSTPIGNNTWMAENLNYEAEGSYCYDNSDINCTLYGRLYTWAAAMAIEPACYESYCVSHITSPHQGVCPKNWHLPDEAEIDELIENAGGASSAGQILKATSGWNSGNGVDALGFTAIPSGCYGFVPYSGMIYNGSGTSSYWWNAAYGSNSKRLWEIDTGIKVTKSYLSAGSGVVRFSIRCIKDSN